MKSQFNISILLLFFGKFAQNNPNYYPLVKINPNNQLYFNNLNYSHNLLKTYPPSFLPAATGNSSTLLGVIDEGEGLILKSYVKKGKKGEELPVAAGKKGVGMFSTNYENSWD